MHKQDGQMLTMMRIITGVAVGSFIVILITAINLNSKLAGVGQLIHSLDGVTEELIVVSAQLSEIDWLELAENINTTAETAQDGLDAAMDAIDTLDIQTLNRAITDLQAVISPLASLMGRFQ